MQKIPIIDWEIMKSIIFFTYLSVIFAVFASRVWKPEVTTLRHTLISSSHLPARCDNWWSPQDIQTWFSHFQARCDSWWSPADKQTSGILTLTKVVTAVIQRHKSLIGVQNPCHEKKMANRSLFIDPGKSVAWGEKYTLSLFGFIGGVIIRLSLFR